jgi:NAD(P)-dependent dehydrogenase (short-subunit alcohol dehydrogenase family)
MDDNLQSLFGLAGRRALITGAGGGIGRVLVDVFRAAGAQVIGADATLAAMDGLDLDERLAFNLADERETTTAIADLLTRAGAPDVLVSNAGFTRAERLSDVDAVVWERELAINLSGARHVSAPIVEAMAARGSGALVFIASVNALAHFGNPAYSAAKAGLVAYARAIAVERGERGVRANVICPGSVQTGAWTHRLAASPGLLENVIPHYPLGRLVKPEEVARTALFLASPASSGMTGAVVPVDAGLTAGQLRFIRDVFGEA